MDLLQRIAVVLALLCQPGMAQAMEFEAEKVRTYKPPLRIAKPSEMPTFSDDQELNGMKLAIQRQLARFAQKSLSGRIIISGKTYPLAKAKETLTIFDAVIDQYNACKSRSSRDVCLQDLNQVIRERFDVFVPNLNKKDPRYKNENFARFTGYHTHQVEGRLQPDAEYKWPIYANPRNSKLNTKTRVQIDFGGALAGRGLEIGYVKNLYDIYLMHVEGSGKLTIPQPDGSVKSLWLQYDGTNQQRWEFISLYMARKGYIVNGTVPSQRRFMREHPELEKEIYSHCPSYVYLKISDKPAEGSDSVAVTDGRSIATDSSLYSFKGLLTYIQTRRPADTGFYNLDEENKSNVPFMNFSRFFLDQDTGGAIEGKARADIYFGADEYAFLAGIHQDELGKIHYLIAK